MIYTVVECADENFYCVATLIHKINTILFVLIFLRGN